MIREEKNEVDTDTHYKKEGLFACLKKKRKKKKEKKKKPLFLRHHHLFVFFCIK